MKEGRREYYGKYRVDTIRLKRWDYGWPGHYFVTICTKGRVPWFGNIVDGEMVLSPEGIIAADEWMRTPDIRPYVTLDDWVIMPDHMHGIVVITPTADDRRAGGCTPPDDGPSGGVKTRSSASLRDVIPSIPPRAGKMYAGNTFGPQSHTLASIIRGYKAAVTTRIRSDHARAFSWLPGYYEHIIRDAAALHAICAYIRANPSRWKPPRYHRPIPP